MPYCDDCGSWYHCEECGHLCEDRWDERTCRQCRGTGYCSKRANMSAGEAAFVLIATCGLGIAAAGQREKCKRCGGTGRL
jgi:hypothetical protein